MARLSAAEKLDAARREGFEAGRLKGHGEGYQDALANTAAGEKDLDVSRGEAPTQGKTFEIILPGPSETLRETGDLKIDQATLGALSEWALAHHMIANEITTVVTELPQDHEAYDGTYIVNERIYEEGGLFYHEFRIYS